MQSSELPELAVKLCITNLCSSGDIERVFSTGEYFDGYPRNRLSFENSKKTCVYLLCDVC